MLENLFVECFNMSKKKVPIDYYFEKSSMSLLIILFLHVDDVFLLLWITNYDCYLTLDFVILDLLNNIDDFDTSRCLKRYHKKNIFFRPNTPSNEYATFVSL